VLEDLGRADEAAIWGERALRAATAIADKDWSERDGVGDIVDALDDSVAEVSSDGGGKLLSATPSTETHEAQDFPADTAADTAADNAKDGLDQDFDQALDQVSDQAPQAASPQEDV
jgi:23S rRNA pseudouridine2605 synthase